jgi:hypothetical protein
LEAADVDAASFLAIAFLTAFVANLVDWMSLQRGFVWIPKGLVAYVSLACFAVMAATAFGLLVRWVPAAVFQWVLMLPMIFLQLATIWARHASKRPSES